MVQGKQAMVETTGDGLTMVTTILGVRHSERDTERAMRSLSEMKKGQRAGLELSLKFMANVKKMLTSGIPKGASTDEIFFCRIMKHAKEKGIEVFPLESNIIYDWVWNKKSGGMREIFLSTAPRERYMVKKIIKTKPDIVIVAVSHADEIHRLLAKQGYPSKVLSQRRNLFGLTASFGTAFGRAVYRKSKAEKIRQRQNKLKRRH